MTVTTADLDAAVTGADAKHAVVSGLADLAAYLETHPGITWPTPAMNIPVHGATPGEKLADLARIAREWDAEITDGPLGMRIMHRKFGDLAVEAHVNPSWTADGRHRKAPLTVAQGTEAAA